MPVAIVNKKLVYDCGCSFDIIDENPPIRVNFIADINKIPTDCPLTWQLLGEGNTKGVFQLETRYGQQSSKKLKPQNIEHLAALSAILRPGCISYGSQIMTSIDLHTDGKYRYKNINIEKLYEKFHRNHTAFQKKIISYDEQNHRLISNRLVDVIYNGKRDIFSIKYRKFCRKDALGSNNLRCTLDHPLLVFGKGWTKVEDMSIGDRFLVLTDGEGFVWASYEGAEFIENNDVFDISVEGPNHNFIANDTIVHNCSQAIRDGKSVTDHYMDRKNGLEEVTLFHPALEPILGPTYGEMIYQEQAMQIAQVFAGFNLQEADVLRKAIGKKKADVMAKVKIEFLAGCKRVGIINDADAEQLFSWIEKSQRYSFNKSHAVCYAVQGYLSAYQKAHFPVGFFVSYLVYAKDKSNKFDEIKLLIANAKMMDVDVLPPDFRNDNTHFKEVNTSKTFNPYNGKIFFGFADIKDVGATSVETIKLKTFQAETALGKTRDKWTWGDFLLFFSQEIKSTVIVAFIESGALDYFRVPRQKMLFDYEQISRFTDREFVWMRQHAKGASTLEGILDICMYPYTKIMDAIRAGKQKGLRDIGMASDKRRVERLVETINLVQNPPYSMVDDPDWVSKIEETRLGTSLTATPLDACKNIYQANATCMDFLKQRCRRNGILINCQIDAIKTHITQNSGDEMAFIEISDQDASIDGIVFANAWKEIKKKQICVVGNTVMVLGERSTKGKDGFIIKDMFQLG